MGTKFRGDKLSRTSRAKIKFRGYKLSRMKEILGLFAYFRGILCCSLIDIFTNERGSTILWVLIFAIDEKIREIAKLSTFYQESN